ncbi:hypothetical protein LSTR_LSTR002666 [Laodelphax striatellus]|uniref:Uncharacterized protein n=1 Tax=Laodelphax striatellus TaxID=195883 RepID=A0A482X5I0_LAOST|nr:hypothetical protein LSTR_LSTR002666 [Laodelphax striatellus]
MRNAAGLDRVGGGVEGGGNLVVADIVVTARSPGVQSTGYQRLKTTSRRRLYRYALCHIRMYQMIKKQRETISLIVSLVHLRDEHVGVQKSGKLRADGREAWMVKSVGSLLNERLE